MRNRNTRVSLTVICFLVVFGWFFSMPLSAQENGGDAEEGGAPQPVEADEELKEQIQFLIDLLDRGNPYLTDWSRQQLIDFGAPAVNPILGALKKADPRRRYLLCEILGEIRDRRAVPELIDHLSDSKSNPSVASAAARSLGKLGDRRAIKPLKDVLSSSDTELVYHAVEALGNLYARSAIDKLLDLVQDDRTTFYETRVGNVAIEALGKLRARKALPEFKNILTSDKKDREENGTGLTVKFYVVRSLEQIALTTKGPVEMQKKKEKKGETTTVQKWVDWINEELGIEEDENGKEKEKEGDSGKEEKEGEEGTEESGDSGSENQGESSESNGDTKND